MVQFYQKYFKTKIKMHPRCGDGGDIGAVFPARALAACGFLRGCGGMVAPASSGIFETLWVLQHCFCILMVFFIHYI